jgi:molecular chaperone GrpE
MVSFKNFFNRMKQEKMNIDQQETNKNTQEQGNSNIEANAEATPEVTNGTDNSAAQQTDSQSNEAESEAAKLKAELAELKDKYLRLNAEFDNYRKRTAKEKVDFLKTANEDLIVSLLPILDDFERAVKAFDKAPDAEAIKEGVQLIYNKFSKTLENKGLKPMESIGNAFDAESHEGITQIPAPSEEMKGKVVDEVEKGYYLNDKVIRFAKVVIGA